MPATNDLTQPAGSPAPPHGGPAPIYRVKAEFFRTLGHPARVRALELLRLGRQRQRDVDSSGASQHLAALRKQGLIEARKEGTSVFYRIKDPRTFQLLEAARQILTTHFEDSQAILGELARPSGEPVTDAGPS